MESESLVMIRCPECGGLMVEGKECRACTGGTASVDGVFVPPALAPSPRAEKRAFPLAAALVAAFVVLLAVVVAAVLSTRDSDPTIEGRHMVEGRGVRLLLPEGWVGGEPGSQVLDQVLMSMRSYGQSYEALAAALESEPGAILLFAVDQAPAADGFATNVNVVAEKSSGDTSVESYLQAALGQLPESFKVQESGVRNVGRYQGAWILTRFELPTGKGRQAAYIVKDGSVFWVVTYTTGVAEFDTRLSDFERSIASIRFD